MANNILVTRSSLPEFDEYVEEIRDIWESHWLTNMGEKHEKFRHELRKYLGVNKIELFTNGHMALELVVQAMGLKGEIITTPFTFASTTHAIVRNGCTPVFCDIDPENYTLDPNKIEALITDKTVAILPVHVYGNICDVKAIESIAKKHDLKVIYDAAHSFGAKYDGKGVGSFGDVSCFSFHATKVFNSIEGGAACFNDDILERTLYGLKNFGIRNEDTIDAVGANAKMNEFCAAMGLCNLRHVDNEIAKRKKIVEKYCERLGGIEGIVLNKASERVESNYSYFPVLFDKSKFGMNRDEVRDILAKHGIGARKYFYPLTSDFECYKRDFNSESTPVAVNVSNNVLTLPLYADLCIDDVDNICNIILQGRKQ